MSSFSPLSYHVALIALAAVTIATAARIDANNVAAANARAEALQQQVATLEAQLYDLKRQTASAVANLDGIRHQAGEATVRPDIVSALSDVCRMSPSQP